MNNDVIFIVTSDCCTQCAMVKSFFKRNNICFNEIDVDSKEGQLWVEHLNIKKLPCVFSTYLYNLNDNMVHNVAQGFEEVLQKYGKDI